MKKLIEEMAKLQREMGGSVSLVVDDRYSPTTYFRYQNGVRGYIRQFSLEIMAMGGVQVEQEFYEFAQAVLTATWRNPAQSKASGW